MGDELQDLVGRQIAKFRKAAGLTQEQLADKLSVALETISRMERGVNTPSIKTLGRIGDALNVPARDFFPPETDATEKDNALDELVTVLKRRQVQEIRLVQEMAGNLFTYLDERDAQGVRPPRKGKRPRRA